MKILKSLICFSFCLQISSVYAVDKKDVCVRAIENPAVSSERALYYAEQLEAGFRNFVAGISDQFFPKINKFIYDPRADGIWDVLAFYAKSLSPAELISFKEGCQIALSRVSLESESETHAGMFLIRLGLHLQIEKMLEVLNGLKFPARPKEFALEFAALTLEVARGHAGGEGSAAATAVILKLAAMPGYEEFHDPGDMLIALSKSEPEEFLKHFKLLAPKLDQIYGRDETVSPEILAQRRKYLVEDLRVVIRDENILRQPIKVSSWWASALAGDQRPKP